MIDKLPRRAQSAVPKTTSQAAPKAAARAKAGGPVEPRTGRHTDGVLKATTTGTSRSKDVIHELGTRAQFDRLFQQGASVTAGAPSELKFLIDRKTGEVFFLPPKYPFHFAFYKNVLHGPMEVEEFNSRAYNRPDRDFIAGTVTAYDSYADPKTGKQGKICFSYWPTDRFNPALLKETHDALRKGLKFLPAGEDIAFRPGGPIQDKLLQQNAAEIKASKLEVKTNLEISKGLKYMELSGGEAVGKLVIIDKGAAMPPLGRGDVALFLGDVPADAPPVAAIMTTQVQTYNSHLGIKYRQDDTPYFYKAFSADEIAALKKLAGKPVKVSTTAKEGTVAPATKAEADAFIAKIRPTSVSRLAPNLTENKARSFADLAAQATGPDGRWNKKLIAAYGRKTLGVAELWKLEHSGALKGPPGTPKVVTPQNGLGIPANWYTRFMQSAADSHGVKFSERTRALTHDPRFADVAWRAGELKKLRKEIEDAPVPADLQAEIRDQVAKPYLEMCPGADRARMRSSAPVVEDSNGKLPNMAGAFDSHSAKWKVVRGNPKATLDNAAKDMADTLKKEYASVWNDRAVSELEFNRVEMDERSVAMSVLVMPSEQDEKANGVVRVNTDLSGFFSVTGETQFGENLITNPEAGAIPDTWVDGNYDVFDDGGTGQDIEYERESNLHSNDPHRKHALSDDEIHAVYGAMKTFREHFARLEGKDPERYNDECEIKITSKGEVLFKQERPWVE